jgi:hypothetical protein
MMKFTVPDFLSRGTFTVELNYYYDQLSDVAERMYFYVRKVPPTPVEIQAVRRQQAGDKLGSFFDWQQHRAVGPPGSISPNGAIDITTGFGEINWEYVQFDEWYLSKGDLRGGNAGYWPPSIGPKFYRPPPQAFGLHPLERSIQDYYSMHSVDGQGHRRRVQDQIGATVAEALSWEFLRLAFPGAPI